MDTSMKSVVSMLASANKLTLFTATGETIEMTNDGPYDTAKVSEFLTPKLTGLIAVDIDLNKFTVMSTIVKDIDALAEEGIIITHIINDKTVQGVFYPEKSSVNVTVGGEDKVEIPYVEHLASHMKRAAEDGSPSISNFFRRLAPVIKSRRHSGEDLMMFIKKSEMPITNDGRIIAYKRVNQKGEHYVDVHSGQIKQRIGSRVTMPVDMVDPSRHNSCSTGLHVANLGYLRSFSGTHTLVVLVDPANFIAVPHGEDTKARVSSYDIIGVLSSTAHKAVCAKSHIQGDLTFEQLLTAAVEGKIYSPIEEIIVGQKSIVSVTPLKSKMVSEHMASKKTTAKSLKETETEDTPAQSVVKQVRETKTTIENADTMGLPKEVYDCFMMLIENKHSKTEIARQLFTSTRSIGRWMDKYDYVSFERKINQTPETPLVTPLEKEEITEVYPEQEDLVALDEMIQSNEPIAGMTVSQQAQALFKQGAISTLAALKKAKKKSWIALGFTDEEVVQIEEKLSK